MNKGKGQKKAHLADVQYEYLPASGMQINGEHHQNSWLVVPKKSASVYTKYVNAREVDDEDDLPIELIEEVSWTKEHWQELTDRATSSSSSVNQTPNLETVKTKLYPVAEDDRELVVGEESRYTWHTWISYERTVFG